MDVRFMLYGGSKFGIYALLGSLHIFLALTFSNVGVASVSCPDLFANHQKKLSFPTTTVPLDVSKFSHVVSIEREIEQCDLSCAIAGQVINLEKSIAVQFGISVEISTNYLHMMGMYKKFLANLSVSHPSLNQEIKEDTLSQTVKEYGIQLEPITGHDEHINITELTSQLNALLISYKKLYLISHSEAVKKAKALLAKAFKLSSFPDQTVIDAAKENAADLATQLGLNNLSSLIEKTKVMLSLINISDDKTQKQERIINKILQELKQNRAIILRYYHNALLLNGDTATYTVAHERIKNATDEMGHLANIVGVKFKDNGQIKSFLVTNTHRNAPYLEMPVEYFFSHGSSISFFLDPNFEFED